MYPAEIERVIHQMPQVHEVAVIGVADEIWGEVGKAFIVFDSRKAESLSQEEVLIHCRHHLAKYKVPKYVEFIAELPKTDSGKILKRKLKHKQ